MGYLTGGLVAIFWGQPTDGTRSRNNNATANQGNPQNQLQTCNGNTGTQLERCEEADYGVHSIQKSK